MNGVQESRQIKFGLDLAAAIPVLHCLRVTAVRFSKRKLNFAPLLPRNSYLLSQLLKKILQYQEFYLLRTCSRLIGLRYPPKNYQFSVSGFLGFSLQNSAFRINKSSIAILGQFHRKPECRVKPSCRVLMGFYLQLSQKQPSYTSIFNRTIA